jgi:hypothetical protein
MHACCVSYGMEKSCASGEGPSASSSCSCMSIGEVKQLKALLEGDIHMRKAVYASRNVQAVLLRTV